MKTWKWILICVVLFVIGIVIGSVILFVTQKPKIEKVIEYKTEWKTKIVKEDCLGLWQCYNSPLMIDIMPKVYGFDVKAYDTCKSKKATYRVIPQSRRNIIIIGGVFNGNYKSRNYSYGGAISYYRLFGLFGFGGGIVGTNKEIGLNAGLIINF